jgi:hypothetical protein
LYDLLVVNASRDHDASKYYANLVRDKGKNGASQFINAFKRQMQHAAPM